VKKCSKCREEQPLAEFPKRSDGRGDGYRNECKSCTSVYRREYYQENRERLITYSTNYNRKHREERNAYLRQHRQKNLSRYLETEAQTRERNRVAIREQARNWEQRHPDKAREKVRLRRSREAQAIHRLSVEEAQQTLSHGCFLCGSVENLAIAHDIPLSKGGSTTIANTFCLCRSCNSQMHTRSLADILEQKKLLEREVEYAT